MKRVGRPINPWLVRWGCPNERPAKTIPNHIAALLPNRTSAKQVVEVMHLLYANYCAACGLPEMIYVAEQVRFARRQFPYKATVHAFEEISCGANPFLVA